MWNVIHHAVLSQVKLVKSYQHVYFFAAFSDDWISVSRLIAWFPTAFCTWTQQSYIIEYFRGVSSTDGAVSSVTEALRVCV